MTITAPMIVLLSLLPLNLAACFLAGVAMHRTRYRLPAKQHIRLTALSAIISIASLCLLSMQVLNLPRLPVFMLIMTVWPILASLVATYRIARAEEKAHDATHHMPS